MSTDAASRIVPRDAASLVLVRREPGKNARILMGRRAGGHQFMPRKWVFPGGRIEHADYYARAASELHPDEAEALAQTVRLARQNGQRLARALALAAVRETFEETGLVLGRRGQPARAPGGWKPFMERGYRPDLSPLRYIARAITPTGHVRRFDARFLMADAGALLSFEPMDSHELGDLGWFTLDECHALEIIDVTRHVLGVVGDILKKQG